MVLPANLTADAADVGIEDLQITGIALAPPDPLNEGWNQFAVAPQNAAILVDVDQRIEESPAADAIVEFVAFRIREPIQTRPMLFDIGAAGPIAGFVVAVPALFLGLQLSHVVPLPDDFVGMSLGEPLLFQFAAWLVWGDAPTGYTINLHPMGLAAWLGLLITALNLFPIGQLDGGHIAYATLGRWSTGVSLITAGIVISLAFFSMSWVIWALLMIAMMVFLGPRHPRTADEHIPLDRTRQWVAVGTAAIFAVCFTPAPIEMMDILTTP